MQLLEIELQATKLEDLIQLLIDGIEDLDATEAALGLDIRNMVKLLDSYVHNDDIHHHGETILEHIREVLQDVTEVTEAGPQRQLLGLIALLHDLGKAYTYELIDGKHTFRKHAETSVKLAEAMLGELRQDDPGMYQHVLDLVRLHDAFMRLHEARKGAANLRYLNKFMREALYTSGRVDDIVTFGKADSFRSKRYQDSLSSVEGILADIETTKRQREAEEALKRRREALPPDTVAALRTLLKAEAPDVVALLPDLKAINKALGGLKLYSVLRQVQSTVKG
jgi:poly(A) polymerase